MRCLATNDGAQDNHGIIAVVERHLMCTINEFERAGNGLHVDVLRQCAMLLQR